RYQAAPRPDWEIYLLGFCRTLSPMMHEDDLPGTAVADHRRRPVIGVMGSGVDPNDTLARAVGGWVARQGFHLLTGGGEGVMAAVSKAFAAVTDRRGLVIGVLPSIEDDPGCSQPAGYPNRWVELAIRTHLPLSGASGTSLLSRNHINVLTADVVVALPGGPGTASEVQLATRYRRPCVALVADRSQIPGLPDQVVSVSTLEEVAAFVLEQVGRGTGAAETGGSSHG
ncbi:MAG: hypothetical protein QGI10_04455, partial [Vicinamibacterales bacterium]|nr:hypothetical protein [Vicinamibacterales bacterium]